MPNRDRKTQPQTLTASGGWRPATGGHYARIKPRKITEPERAIRAEYYERAVRRLSDRSSIR